MTKPGYEISRESEPGISRVSARVSLPFRKFTLLLPAISTNFSLLLDREQFPQAIEFISKDPDGAGSRPYSVWKSPCKSQSAGKNRAPDRFASDCILSHAVRLSTPRLLSIGKRRSPPDRARRPFHRAGSIEIWSAPDYPRVEMQPDFLGSPN
jgi:hypothetical protein